MPGLCSHIGNMRVIARPALIEFSKRYPDAQEPLEAWYHILRHRAFRSPHEIKSSFATASFLRDGLVVFNIGGNKYRLVCHVRYDLGIVFVKRVLTHREYDELNASGALTSKRGRDE
jgi:mRNA interferase HigB